MGDGTSTSTETIQQNTTSRNNPTDGPGLVFSIVSPFIFIPGILLNILSIVILRRREVRPLPTTTYLLALAVTDILSLALPLFRVWLTHATGFDIRAQSSAACKVHFYFTYIAVFSAYWIQGAVNVDRVIHAKFRIKWYAIKVKHRIGVIAGIVAFHSLLSIHFLVYFKIVLNNPGHQPCYMEDEGYKYFLKHIWTWIDLVVGFLLPFVTMVICSIVMIQKLWKSKNDDESEQCIPLESSRPKDIARATTKMLIWLNVVFFISILPQRILTIVTSYGTSVDRYTYATCYLLMYVTHAVNFILYVYQGPRYRLALYQLFGYNRNRENSGYGANVESEITETALND